MKRKAKKDDIRQLYIKYKGKFYRWAEARFPRLHKEVIADAYQDAIIAFMEACEQGRYDKAKASQQTYLFTIGKYILIKKSKQKIESIVVEEEAMAQIANDFDIEPTQEREKQLLVALKKIDPKCKSILVSFYYEDKQMDQIANELDLKNRNVVKVSKFRCLQKLKKLIKQE